MIVKISFRSKDQNFWNMRILQKLFLFERRDTLGEARDKKNHEKEGKYL
jgi:hypothetical protein